MSFERFIQLLRQHLFLIVFFPIFTSIVVYYLTQNEVRTYTCTSVVYTGIVSGYNYRLQEGLGSDKKTNPLFSNIMFLMGSESILEEVSARLMAQHLMEDIDNVNPMVCGYYPLQLLHYYLPEDVRSEVVVENNLDSTFKNILVYLQGEQGNAIYRLVHASPPYSNIPFYSLPYLKGITNLHRGNSDMIQSTYRSIDPAVTYYTLVYFNEVFYYKYDKIKKNETSRVLAVFEKQLKMDQIRLESAEKDMLDFNEKYRILDFPSQMTEYVSKKRSTEEKINIELLTLSALNFTNSYTKNQLDVHLDVLNINSELIAKRDELEELAIKYAMDKTFQKEVSNDSIFILEERINLLRSELELELDKIFEINFSPSGVKASVLLSKWFTTVILIGESKARLQLLQEQLLYFDEIFSTWGPLNSNYKQMTRAVNLAQQRYVKTLESLNKIRSRESHYPSSKSFVATKPEFPKVPDPSKRPKQLVIAFLVAGFFIILLITLVEFLNSNIRKISTLNEVSLLNLASAFPYFPKKSRKIDYNVLKFTLTQRLIKNIQKELTSLLIFVGRPNSL